MSLIDAVLQVSGVDNGIDDEGLSDESRQLIATVDQPVDLQVFVTPT